MQILKQNKYGKLTLYFIIIAMFLNAIVKNFTGIYAEPFAEVIIILVLPQLYYMFMMILNHSYFSTDNARTKRTLILCTVIAALDLFPILVDLYIYGFGFIFNNQGLVSGNITYIYGFLVFGLIPVAYKVRQYLDKKENIE